MATSPPPGGLSPEQFKEYMKWLEKQSSSGTNSPLDSSILNNKLGETTKAAKQFGDMMAKGATEVFDSWQKLSASGSNFSGDLIGMTKAAYNSRMEFGQWSDLIKENGAKLSSLGGNVTRGSEAFTRLSKDFFDSGISTELRNIGYTSKDLNEILAIQAATQKSGYKDTEEGRRKSYMAAKELAEQMDAIAKLTGKSREQQMEEMKKKQVDGQVEAKLRLLANGDMQKYAQLQSEYQKLALEAKKRGDEELFKQQFATGTYMTKAAGTQAAVLGQQSRAVEEAAARLAKGDLAGAREASAKADAAALKNANDKTILTLATAGEAGGAAASAAQKSVEATDTMYHNVVRVAEANGILLKTQQDYAVALKLAMEDIRQTQKGRRQDIDPATGNPTGPYKDVGQSSRVGVAIQSATQDVKSAAATIGAATISPETLKQLDDLAAKYYTAGLAKGLEQKGLAGINNQNSTPQVGPDGKTRPGGPVSPTQADEEKGGVLGSAANAIKTVTDLTVNAVTGVANIFLDGKKIGGRSSGSMGTVGKMIEDFGQGTLTMLHGREGVVTENQLMNLASGMKDVGLAGAVNTLKSSMPKNQNFDISKISKDITTSISTISNTVTGGGETTTKRIQSDDSKQAEKERDTLFANYDKQMAAMVEKMRSTNPEASEKELARAARKTDEFAEMYKQFDEARDKLNKKIEDGITWETTKKEEQLATTKKITSETITTQTSAMVKTDAMRLAEIQKKRDTEATKPTGPGGEYTRKEAEIEAARLNKLSLEKFKIDSARALGGSTGQPSQPGVQVPNLPSMDLNALNLPGIGPSIKAKAANVAAPKSDTPPAQTDPKKPADGSAQPGATAKPSTTGGKEATLNDVVASLNTLNTKMGQLLAQHEDLGNKQVRATKNVGSGNLYKA